jgi:predicted RNA-binding protein with EMAP domain
MKKYLTIVQSSKLNHEERHTVHALAPPRRRSAVVSKGDDARSTAQTEQAPELVRDKLRAVGNSLRERALDR